jgi:hypothetical protein
VFLTLFACLFVANLRQQKREKNLQITRAPNRICQTNTRAAQKEKFSSPRQREYEQRENTRAFVVGFFLALDDDEQRERRCTAAH